MLTQQMPAYPGVSRRLQFCQGTCNGRMWEGAALARSIMEQRNSAIEWRDMPVLHHVLRVLEAEASTFKSGTDDLGGAPSLRWNLALCLEPARISCHLSCRVRVTRCFSVHLELEPEVGTELSCLLYLFRPTKAISHAKNGPMSGIEVDCSVHAALIAIGSSTIAALLVLLGIPRYLGTDQVPPAAAHSQATSIDSIKQLSIFKLVITSTPCPASHIKCLYSLGID